MTEREKMILISVQLHTLSTSSMVSETLVHAEEDAGWSQKLVWIFLGKRKIHCPYLISNYNSSAMQPIA
jgi:hypothetical protein